MDNLCASDDYLSKYAKKKVSVVIPCYRVKTNVLSVIEAIDSEIYRIYVVDDCCPEGCGDFVELNFHTERIIVLRNKKNLGVGGAVLSGYKAAIIDGADVIIKIDGDGQMDPVLIPLFVNPILKGMADYTKGNRFYDLTNIRNMPFIRLVGNAILSFLTKISSGYWSIFDPTN